jgi:hypothetical protein
MAASATQAQQAQYQQAMNTLIAQQAAAALRGQDLAFMRSLEQIAACPITGGNGTTANYVVGSTFYFDLPVMPSGFAKGLIIKYNLTVTPATASGASYAVNAAKAFAIFSEMQIQYNGMQARTHPILLKYVDMTRGFLRGAQNDVLAGNKDSTIQQNIVGSTPIVVNVGNTWQGQFYFPFNALSEDDVRGLLPASGAGTHAQLKLTTPANFMGNDPLINPIAGSGGVAPSVAATGTISVDMVYLDGHNLDGPSLLPPPPSVYGSTLQYYWEPSLTPLNTNAFSRQTVNNKMKHHYMLSIVIDGVQSNQFAQWSNISAFELTGDLTGSQKLKSWNVSNNVSIYDYFDREIRRKIGQDLDPGVILWVASPIRGTVNASNRMGQLAANMYPGGFPTLSHGYNVVSPGTPTGYSPRVETLLISENMQGLGLQQVGVPGH